MIIAATALYHGMSLLSDNLQEFSRVPNLRTFRSVVRDADCHFPAFLFSPSRIVAPTK